jgi:hypothetical protein
VMNQKRCSPALGSNLKKFAREKNNPTILWTENNWKEKWQEEKNIYQHEEIQNL